MNQTITDFSIGDGLFTLSVISVTLMKN